MQKLSLFPKILAKSRSYYLFSEDRLLFILSIFKVRILSPDPMLVIVKRGSRIFRRGGGVVQPSEKFLTSKKKKKTIKRKKGRGRCWGVTGGLSIYSALVWSKSIFAIETNSFTDNDFYKYDIPRYFLQAKHIRDDCFRFVKCISESGVARGRKVGGGAQTFFKKSEKQKKKKATAV